MDSLDEFLEFTYSIRWIISEIRIDIIVVADRVRRACLTLYELWVRWVASLFTALCGMAQHACKPDVAAAEPFEIFQGRYVDVGKFSCAVVCKAAVLLRPYLVVSPETGQHLIYYRFVHYLKRCLKTRAKIAFIFSATKSSCRF